MRPTRATERPRPLSFALRATAAALVPAAMLGLAACVTVAPPPPAAPSAVLGADRLQVEQLTRALAERDKSLESMQTRAVMEYTAGDQHLKAKEDITVRRPNCLRVDAMSPFGVALVLAAQGGDVAIFEPGKNRFMRGAATADTLDKYVRIPMAPADAVGLLMGLAPHGFAAGSAADSVANDGPMLVAEYGSAGADRRQLGFADGRLVMVRDTAADGRVRYEVRYSDYHDIGGLTFPYVVDANFPMAQSRVTFRYVRPIINGDVPAATFVLTPAPGATLMNLSRGGLPATQG